MKTASHQSFLVPAALILVIVALLVGGPILSGNPTQPELKVSNVTTQPDKFYGKNVSVKGKVNRVIGSQAFLMDGSGGEKILVLTRGTVIEPIGGSGNEGLFSLNDPVEISGSVQPFHLDDMETLLGTDLRDSNFSDWEGKPVIVADTVRKK